MSDLSGTTALPLADIAATEALGRRLAGLLQPGDVVTLSGDLGAGKSTLARALIRHLAGSDIDVPSPTFTLVQTYDTRPSVWHFDLYRIEDPEEIPELGWDEALGSAASLVEWPERLGYYLPADRLDVALAITQGDTRTATLTPYGSWIGRIL